MSYAAAKAVSKEKEKFGKGSIDGLMAAETGDMSSIPGHIIPVPGARHPGLGALGGADGRDDHPRHPARPDADDRAPAIHLRRGGDDYAGHRSRILLFGLFGVRPLLLVLQGPAHRS